MTPQSVTRSDDQQAINEIVRAFFDLFTNRGGARPDLRAIFDICIPEAVISKCVSPAPEVNSLEAFIAPREALLSNGTLTDFQEVETSHHTQVFGNIAQRVCTYSKSGVLDGSPFQSRGVKVFQFIRCPNGWRISAVSWDDEREGFSLEAAELSTFEQSEEHGSCGGSRAMVAQPLC